MPFINQAAFEEVRRHQQITKYEIYPLQSEDIADYQVLAEDIPSVISEDVRILQKKAKIPFWAEEKGKAWSKIAKLMAKTPQELFALSGNPSASLADDGDNVFEFFDDFVGIDDFSGFTLVQRYNLDHYGHQGVAFDGTYIYATVKSTNKELAKFNLSSGKVAENITAADEGTAMAQINGTTIKDNKLYVGSNNYSTTPKKGYIKVFNCSDLSYIEEHQVKDHWCEGCSFHDNAWWVIYSDYKYVSKYDISWNHVVDYPLSYSMSGPIGYCNGYQGITWKDDYIFVNIHSGCTPLKCDVYEWNGSGFDEVVRLDTEDSHDTQGVFWDGEYMWWAERNYYGSLQNAVSKTSIDIDTIIDSSKWTNLGGSFEIDLGKLKDISSGLGHHILKSSWSELINYISETQIKGGETAGGCGGVCTQTTDINNFHAHYLLFNPESEIDRVRWKKMVSGAFTSVLLANGAVGITDWHKLKVVKIGNQRKIYLDSVEKINTSNADLSDAYFGVWHYSSTTYPSWTNWVFDRKYASIAPLILQKQISGKADAIRAVVG